MSAVPRGANSERNLHAHVCMRMSITPVLDSEPRQSDEKGQGLSSISVRATDYRCADIICSILVICYHGRTSRHEQESSIYVAI